MLHLNLVFIEEATKEIQRWDHQPMLMEVDQRHCLIELWEREDVFGGSPPSSNLLQWKEALLHELLQLCLCHRRRYPLTHLVV